MSQTFREDVAITVQKVSWPTEGKRVGSVTDTTGKRWGVFPDKLGGFVEGGSYTIKEYSAFTTNNGNVIHTIKVARPGGAAPSPSNGQSAPQSGPPPNDNQRRMDIFVCGAFNNLLANPSVKAGDLTQIEMIDILHKIKSSWVAVFGPTPINTPAAPQRPAPSSSPRYENPDMNDDIPF